MAAGSLGCMLLSGLAWKYKLQPYQKERILTFLDPSRDLRGKGYPWPLGIPAAFLSIVWVGVCLFVPDRENPPLPREQLPPNRGD